MGVRGRNWAYDPDLEVGGEAAEDGALGRRGVLLRLGRHRRWRAAAMRPGMARVFGGKRRRRRLRLRLE